MASINSIKPSLPFQFSELLEKFLVSGPGLYTTLYKSKYSSHIFILNPLNLNSDFIKDLYFIFENGVLLRPSVFYSCIEENEYYFFLEHSRSSPQMLLGLYSFYLENEETCLTHSSDLNNVNTDSFKIITPNVAFICLYYYLSIDSGLFSLTELEYIDLFKKMNNFMISNYSSLDYVLSDFSLTNKEKLIKIYHAASA